MVLAQRYVPVEITSKYYGFHPTMVLAQQKVVSLDYFDNILFPSHYGSRSTILASRDERGREQFPSHYGSRSTLREDEVEDAKYLVSIPLWFSLNNGFAYIAFYVVKFPSHYGSRSTGVLYAGHCNFPWFPSHYGSRSTYEDPEHSVSGSSVSIPLWFSLNDRNILLSRRTRGVSIPLWFSLNQEQHGTGLLRNIRFHPTMVLAQQYLPLATREVASSFHPTMVLAQHLEKTR